MSSLRSETAGQGAPLLILIRGARKKRKRRGLPIVEAGIMHLTNDMCVRVLPELRRFPS